MQSKGVIKVETKICTLLKNFSASSHQEKVQLILIHSSPRLVQRKTFLSNFTQLIQGKLTSAKTILTVIEIYLAWLYYGHIQIQPDPGEVGSNLRRRWLPPRCRSTVKHWNRSNVSCARNSPAGSARTPAGSRPVPSGEVCTTWWSGCRTKVNAKGCSGCA